MTATIYAGQLARGGVQDGQIRVAVTAAGGVAGWAVLFLTPRVASWIGLRGEVRNNGLVLWGNNRTGNLHVAGTFEPRQRGLQGVLSVSSGASSQAESLAFGATLNPARSLADRASLDPSTPQLTAYDADRVLAWLADSRWEATSVADRAYAWGTSGLFPIATPTPDTGGNGGASGGNGGASGGNGGASGGLDVSIGGGQVGGVSSQYQFDFDPNTVSIDTGGTLDDLELPRGGGSTTPAPTEEVGDGRPSVTETEKTGVLATLERAWNSIPQPVRLGGSAALLYFVVKKRLKNGR